MKAEKFLKKLGLSVNIVIIILLLVIVYLLHCINDSLSLERFSIGGQMARVPSAAQIEVCAPGKEYSEACQDTCVGYGYSTACPEYCYRDESGACMNKRTSIRINKGLL